MQINTRLESLAEIQADWLIAWIWENDEIKGALAALDTSLGGAVARLLARGDATGKAKELTPILDTHGIVATRILLVGLGPKSKADIFGLMAAGAAAARLVTAKAHERVGLA